MTDTRVWTSSDSAVGERERPASERAQEHVCPECGGTLVTDEEHGETACSDCGLVVEEDGIDHGPEWRAFDSRERDRKARVG